MPTFLEVISPQNVTRMKEIAQIGGGILYDAILSADQQKLLAVFSNAVKIYNVNTLEEMSSCSLEISEVPYASTKSWAGTAHAFSQDGAIFVFLGINSVEIWNIKECSLIQTFVLDQQLADCAYQVSQLDLRISPDNQIVALSVNGRNCGYQPQVRWIWKVSDGSLLLKDSGRAIAFSADGSMIATGGSGYQPISLWSTSDFELIRSLPGQNNTLDLFFLPDGNLLSCYENWIWTWEIDSGKVLKQIPNRDNMKCNLMIINGEVLILTANKLWRLRDEKYIPAPDGHTVDNISPDGKTLFSRFWDNSTKQIVSRLWRLDDDKLLETFIDATSQFSSDGLIIAVNSYPEPQNTQLMNANDGSLINTLEGNKPIFSLDGLALITWSSDHLLKWNIQDGTLISSQQYSQTGNPTGHVDQVSFSPDGLNLAAFQRDPEMFDSPGEITIYSLMDLLPIQRISGKGGHSFAFSPNGEFIAVSTGQIIELRQTLTGNIVSSFDIGDSIFRTIGFSPDGALFVTDKGNRIYIWRVEDKKNLGQFSAGGRIINDLSFTSSAEQIIVRINVSAHSESIISFELPNGSILTRHDFSTMICNPTGCNGVGYQPLSISGDKKYLAVITNEFKVNVIRIEDWEIENTIVVAPGPEAANEGIITLSQEGNILATNFNDGQVRLWDVTNGTLLGTINVYPALKDVFSPEVAMSFSPDGRLLAVSGLGIIHLYGVVP